MNSRAARESDLYRFGERGVPGESVTQREAHTMQPDDESRETKEQGVLKGKPVSRRQFLKYTGIAGLAIGASGAVGSLVSACAKEETGTSVSVGGEPPAQDKITIGAARPISG